MQQHQHSASSPHHQHSGGSGLFGTASAWPESLYPSLHAPISPSVSLQWTHRDHNLVNLPVNLLVRGDVVEIRPGQTVHAKVKQVSFPILLIIQANFKLIANGVVN